MAQKIKILEKEFVTHDVVKIVLERPTELSFKSGQAADIAVNKPGWENELRPFTFTSLPAEDHVEFTIKIYPDHNGVTQQIGDLKVGDELLIGDVFGDIGYKGEGIFIAGGAGVTPFIAIVKELSKENKIGNNKMIFANKTKADIILEDKFNSWLGKNFINILSADETTGYEHGYISVDLINKYREENIKYYYLCGPEPMMAAVEKQLHSLGITDEYIVKEAY